jgi:hypothetical protein
MDQPTLIPLAKGTNNGKSLILINGYKTEKYRHPCAFVPEVTSLRSLGWKGDIYLFAWDSSHSSSLLYSSVTLAHWHMVKDRAKRTGHDHFLDVIHRNIDYCPFVRGASALFWLIESY